MKRLINDNPSLVRADDGAPESPLAGAVREGNKAIVEYLLEAGAMPQ